jgi:hypothetical protein
MIIAAASQRSAAQEVLSPPLDAAPGDLPPDMSLSDDLPSGLDPESGAETIEPIPEPYIEGSMGPSYSTDYVGDPRIMATCPPLFESSGTWLRRGFWYAEADLILANKAWDRKGLLLAFEGNVSASPGTSFGQVGFGPVLALNNLVIDGSAPGAQPMARVSLGRFLFRDGANRDHVLQGSALLGGVWNQNSVIGAATPGGIQINDFIDRVNPSFDGAQQIGFLYSTSMSGGEVDYIVKQRMQKDQMVLQPNGDWVRRANPSNTYSFLAGIRGLSLTETLNINADRNPDVAASEGGVYNIRTSNNLLGTQIGGSVSYETARWSLGTTIKGGPYYNAMRLRSNFSAGPAADVTTGAVNTGVEPNISFIGELQVLGKWHLRPNVSLRAGFEILYVDSIALAPSQINFVTPGYLPIADDGDIFCMGSSIGIEMYR